MRAGDLPRPLRRVVGDAAVAIDAAERPQRKSLWGFERPRLPLRIDRTEHEQAVTENRCANSGASVAQSRRDRIHGALDALQGVVGRLERVRTRVAENAALQLVRARLCYDVDHAARRLPELRLVAAGLYLDFLHEIVRRAAAERAEHDRVRPQRAVTAVGNVHTVYDVLVLEAARSLD